MPFLLCAVISLYLCFPPSKGEWIENKGLWYYISQDESPVNYQQATGKCESMKARLAVIANKDQDNFIKERTNDGVQRWIGLSNNKQNHTSDSCKRKPLVWNYDEYCSNTFKMFDTSFSAQCMAIVSKFGTWSLKSCTNVYGFICQWECKKMYLQFETLKTFSGIYELSYYWYGNIVYRKQGPYSTIELWKGENTYDWNLTIYQSRRYHTTAFHKSRLYVPYGNSTNWKTPAGKSISYNFVCIECNKLSVCLNAESEDELCYSQLSLKFDDNSNPEYIDNTSDVIIYHNYKSFYCICVDQQQDCGFRCGYIFPYPKRTTTLKLDDESKVDITNLCLPGNDIISDKSDTTVPSVAVSVVVLVITIVAIVVSCIVLRRRRCTNSGSHGAYINDNISNTERSPNEVATNDNMYVDCNEPCVDNQSSETYNEGQYTYAGLAIPTNITPKVNISSKMEMVKVSYGVQNDDVPKPVNDNKEGIDELYAKVNKQTISSANVMEGSGKTVTQSQQLITVKANTETEEVQHTDDDSKLSDDNPATHNNGDDDLELFENSVYESTQG